MDDSRTLAVLVGAAALVGSLFAPWYAIEFGNAAREAISQQAGQLPGSFGEFTRGLVALLPERIVANGWQVFERTDVALLGCALAAALSALLGRLDVARLAGGAAVVTTLLAIIDKPGPGNGIVQLQWGPWAALAAAGLIVAAASTRARREAATVGVDRSTAAVIPAAAMLADRPDSVAPPS